MKHFTVKKISFLEKGGGYGVIHILNGIVL
jgi:hypothetical protein